MSSSPSISTSISSRLAPGTKSRSTDSRPALTISSAGVATIIGGYIGARTARKVSPRYIRAIVTVVSAGITIAFFLRRH